MSMVAAIAVVLIHAGNGGMGSSVAKVMHQFFGWGLCTFAVPWFFFASGYFFAGHLDKPGWWRQAVLKRGKTILLPYVIWCGTYMCLSIGVDMLSNVRVGKELMYNQSLWSWFCAGLGLDVSQHPLLVPFWYIRTLMLIVALSPILVYAIRKLRWYVPLAMMPPYIFCCGMHDRYAMPWFIFYSLFSLTGYIYFSVGVLARLDKWEQRRWHMPTWILWAAALPTICIGRLALYNRLPMVANTLWLFAIPILLLGVWRLIPNRAWPRWFVAAAFPVYAVHYFVERALESTVLPISHPAWWAYILRFVCAVIFSLCVAVLSRHCFPRIASILWGGR